MNLAKVFPFRRLVRDPRVRLLCFPYAGGAALLYRQWSDGLPPGIELCPVELPGRGVRLGEAPVSDMSALCDGVVAAIDALPDNIPIALFGHSMGARIAFEVARRLDGRIAHLFASGSPAPGTRRNVVLDDPRPTAELSDAEFKQRLRELGGTPHRILDDDDMMAYVLPTLRADFVLIESYRPEPQHRVSCPITVFAGADDPGGSATDAEMIAWEQRTTARCRIIGLDAGHFFLGSHRAQLLREIAHDVAPWLA
jgi:medium-chain acyl-[acyl-carrier-protein] hydrolase